MSYSLFCTHPPSTTSFLVPFVVLACSPLRWSSFAAKLGVATPHTRALLHTSSNRSSWLVSDALFHVLRADHSHVHHYLLLKFQGVPLRPLDAQVMCLAQNCSCKSSQLSPCLHFKKKMIPPRLLLFSLPSSHPHSYRFPKKKKEAMAMVESSSSTITFFTPIHKDNETFLPAALPP